MATQSKVIFLDVDGTYVNERGLVPASAQDAVVAARANGHRVFLCTGRSLAELWDHIMEAGFDGIIASAGGYIELDGQVLLHRSVPIEDVRHVVEFFGAHRIDYYLEANSGLYGSPNSKHRLRQLLYGGITDEDILAELEKGLGPFIDSLIDDQDLVRSDINKISFLGSEVSIEAIRAEFGGSFEVIPATVPQFGANSGEMSIPGIHKATAIALLLAHLGIDQADTIAFGDGLNDLEMFDYVHVGVAMATAHPTLVAAADRVTGGPDEDGIAAGFAACGLL